MKDMFLLTASITILAVSPCLARPVTVKDMSNKTVCWNDGDKETFRADGKWYDRGSGKGTWAWTPTGIQFNGENFVGRYLYEIDNKGELTATRGGDKFWGHFCS
jgi:hypothetical protein